MSTRAYEFPHPESLRVINVSYNATINIHNRTVVLNYVYLRTPGHILAASLRLLVTQGRLYERHLKVKSLITIQQHKFKLNSLFFDTHTQG